MRFLRIKLFFENTTLHGFKYLNSAYISDRIWWLACCTASGVCAGVLCAVLWERFLHVPALLIMRSPHHYKQPTPTIAVCLPPEKVGYAVIEGVSANVNETQGLAAVLSRLLQHRHNTPGQLMRLDKLFSQYNTTFTEAVVQYTPPCENFIKKYRYKKKFYLVPQNFQKILVEWGVCCVLQLPKDESLRKLASNEVASPLRTISLALECTDERWLYGCQFYAQSKGEDAVESLTLLPSYVYWAHMSLAVQDTDKENLIDYTCVSDPEYSQSLCTMHCMETACGCYNPFKSKEETTSMLEACSLSQLSCLNSSLHDISGCECLPPCQQLTTQITMVSSNLRNPKTSFEPIFKGLNKTAIVLLIEIRMLSSKIFTRFSTESWISLLSSLGGVFNMFLGVGLFSALEFLFFIILRLGRVDPTIII